MPVKRILIHIWLYLHLFILSFASNYKTSSVKRVIPFLFKSADRQIRETERVKEELVSGAFD